MGRRWSFVSLLAVCIGVLEGSLCEAREPYFEFLRGLQRRGMGEQGLAYIDQIAGRADLPDELKETLDLERSKCLRVAAGEANDAQQRSTGLAEAKRLSEKFFKEHPAHPAAAALILSEGDDALVRGEQKLAMARGASDKDVREKSLVDARAPLNEARDRYDAAIQRLKEWIEARPKPTAEQAERKAEDQSGLTQPWIEARSKSAYTIYLLAQTYSDSKSPERRKLLQQAGKGFDGVYQEYRGLDFGMLAHVWHGRTLDELGDAKAAMSIYDEVLIVDPETPDAEIALASLFGQAELFRLQSMAKSDQLKSVVEEGEQWLALHKGWQPTSPYQGIALEIAKAKVRAADVARPGPERTKFLRDSAAALAAIGKVDTEHRQEALKLRRETIARLGSGTGLSLTEALTLGDEAAGDGNWAEAGPLYQQALDLAKKANDAKNQEAAKTRLAQALYRQAINHYSARDLEKTLTLCGRIVGENPDSPLAQDASALAIAAALAAFADAPDAEKPKAMERLERVAGYATRNWSDKPVADDARMAMAQAALLQGDLETTESRLGEVNSQSKRYASALQLRGQVQWRKYLTAKRAADAESNAAEIARLREAAVTSLNASLERHRGSWQSASEPMPSALFDSQLLLGEIHLEGQQWAEAVPLFEPLVAHIKSAKPTQLERSAQRALVGAVRVGLATNNPSQAAEAAQMLVDSGQDEEELNGVLVELARLVGQQIKQAVAAASAAEPATFAVAPFADPLRELHGRLVEALAPRKSLTLPQLMYLGDASISLDRSQQAREIYERVLAAIDRDESAKASAGAAAIGIRARFVSLLRTEGQLDEAAKQVDALIKERPNALEPLMEKGLILQGQAERDPKRYDECIAHWTELRVRLGRSNPRPSQYYDVLYNAAACLVRQSRLTNDQQKALQAEKLLKSSLTLSPNLNGPDSVAKYNALLTQAVSLRGANGPAPPDAQKR